MGLLVLMVTLPLAACFGPDEVQPPPYATDCVGDPLPLQNAASFTLGETFYLPRVDSERTDCPADAAWQVLSAPGGSLNAVYHDGAPEPRFTPDVAGSYTFHVPDLRNSEFSLTVVARTPAERFRNHYLTPMFGAALVGDELWTANGPAYTVTRVTGDGSGDPASYGKRDEITVGSWPGAIAWREPLAYALVAHRGSDTVGFVDRERGVLEDALWVGDEPTGLAITADASTLYVSLATMREVAVVDLATRTVASRIPVGFDPRALVLSSDGARLFVASHRSGNRNKDTLGNYGANDDLDIWVIDTATLAVDTVVEDVSNVLRDMALASDDSELYIVGTDIDPIPSQNDPNAESFVHEIVVVSAEPSAPDYGQVVRRADLSRQPSSADPVVNPAGVAATETQLWIAAESSNALVALDRQTLEEQLRVDVGAGARQLVVLDNGSGMRTVAVHCYQSFETWMVAEDGQIAGTVALANDPRPTDVALGERVFTRPGNDFAANHSCSSSCHVEGQNDGAVWSFGPNIWHNARPLQLLEATTPIEWGAYVSNTEIFGYGGPASIVGRPASPEEAVGLEKFLGSLLGAPRATGWTRVDGSYTEAALRGKELFEGRATCSSCHTPPLYTNRQFIAEGKSGEPADVPTLLGAYRHGVYFVAGQSRSIEDAVDVALAYVDVVLSAEERSDLIAFLYQLTPKGSAPRAIWPDIDSAEAVYPLAAPWVEFADPVAAAANLAEYVVLEDDSGAPVPASVAASGGRITLTPEAPLSRGASYRFRVLPGLPFRSGGALTGERSTQFVVAEEAQGNLPATLMMTVTVGSMMGPVDIPLMLQDITPTDTGYSLVVAPVVFGSQQRQPVTARIDGQRILMDPLALPLPPGSVANAAEVEGTITEVDGDDVVTRIDGTLRLQGPGIDIPGVPMVIVAPPAP